MKYWLWVVIYWLSLSIIFAQSDSPYFHHLTIEDGLTDGINYFVSKDSRGFVWISSTSGLNRYDGSRINTYLPGTEENSTSLFGGNIQSRMFEVENGDLWFTTYEGINLYRRKTDDFWHTIFVDKNGAVLKGYHAFHLDHQGMLWIIVDNKSVYLFDTEALEFHFKHSLPLETFRLTLVLKGDGSVSDGYSASKKAGLTRTTYLHDGSTKQITRNIDYLGEPVYALQILPESDTLIWLATRLGLLAYNWENERLLRYAPPGSAASQACNALVKFGRDSLLLAFENGGILVFDRTLRTFIEQYVPDLRNPNTLATNNVPVISALNDGSFWLSTQPKGIDFFYPAKKKFNIISPPLNSGKQVSPFNVTCLLEDSAGKIWCGTSLHGLLKFGANGKKFKHFDQNSPSFQSIPNKKINHLFEDKNGRIWVMANSGTRVWLPNENRFVQISKERTLYGIQLEDGRVLLSPLSPGGLVQVEEEESGYFNLQRVLSVDTAEAYSLLWQDALGRLFGCKELISIPVFDPVDNFKLIKELPYSGISSFSQVPSDSAIWISNSYGLLKIGEALNEKSVVKYTQKDGLPTSQISSFVADDYGQLWLGTNKGLTRLDPVTQRFHNFTLADGLPSLNFNNSSVIKSKTGELWFGTVAGIVHFWPETVNLLTIQTTPVFTNILVNDVEVPNLKCTLTGAANVSEIQQIELPYEKNTLSFSYAALEYSDPPNTKYSFQMDGFDPDWLSPTKRDFIRYGKLPFGHYVFRVKAANSDGIWGHERKLEIIIEKPYYRRWWFYALMIALGLGVIYGIMWYRLQRRESKRKTEEEKREALEQERQRIARDMHDDLGSSLSALSLTTEIARHKKTSELKAEIEKINTSAREISGKIREVIWTVSSRNDSLDNLVSYLNNYAHDLFESTSQDFYLKLPENIPDIFINGEYRRNMFLAFKEALNNLMKYAGATRVSIDFEITGEQFSIRVTDNGIGFDPALLQNSAGNGLRNMHSRMKGIGGTCEISTGKEGTSVHFGFPLNR
jgi:signal transduction histidine kinase/ligand-binding sensor domain-containing protein